MSVSISGQSTDGSLQSNPSSSTKLVNSSLKDVYTASQYLEAATRAIIEAANNGTWREVASKYYATHCGGFHDMDTNLWADMTTGGGAVTQIEEYLKANPDFHSVVEDITVDVNKQCTHAIVWMVRTDSGLADGLRRESVLKMTWVRTSTGWCCVDSSGIRHFPFYLAHAVLGGGGM